MKQIQWSLEDIPLQFCHIPAFYLLCSARTEIWQFVSLFASHLGSQNNTHVSQIFEPHPKEKLGKTESFFFSVVLHYVLKVLSTATIPLVFECRSNKELTIKIIILEHLLTTSFKEFAIVRKNSNTEIQIHQIWHLSMSLFVTCPNQFSDKSSSSTWFNLNLLTKGRDCSHCGRQPGLKAPRKYFHIYSTCSFSV